MPDNDSFLLGQMNGKLDQLLKRFDKLDERVDAVDTRVTVIEKSKWKVYGIASALGTALGGLVGAFTNQK